MNATAKSAVRLLLAMLFAGSMWSYVQHIVIPHQQADANLKGIPRGNLSDLYPRWLGARELLLHRRDPYSAEITREIQEGYYGRALDPARPNDPKDEQGFAYPAYIVFLFAPTVGLPFEIVQTAFRWLLLALTVTSVPLWLRVSRWKVSAETLTILMVMTVGSFPVLQGIKLQQLSLLVAGLIAVSAALLVQGRHLAAGILLALAMIKPQLALPVAVWLLLWALSDWPRRRTFFWGFAVTMAALVGGAEYVLPGWIGRFREALVAYQRYNRGADSILETLLTPIAGKVVIFVLLAAVAWVAKRNRHAVAGARVHSQVTGLVLVATVLVMPKTAPYNQVLLLPAVLVVLRQWRRLWSGSFGRRAAVAIGATTLAWPWLAASGLLVASIFVSAASVQAAWLLPLYTSLVIPLALLGLLLCGWSDFVEVS